VKTFVLIIWGAIATVLGFFGSQAITSSFAPAGSGNSADAVTIETLKPISIPVIENSDVRGYLVVRLALSVVVSASTDILQIEATATDETIKSFMGMSIAGLEVAKERKLDRELQSVVDAVNSRLGQKAIRAAQLQELNFIDRSNVRSGRGG
jgi:hypothetical protein